MPSHQRVAVLDDVGIGRGAATVARPLKRQASISAVWREERRAALSAEAHGVWY